MAMRFRVKLSGQCSGGNHLHGEISIAGGAFRPFAITRDELKAVGGADTPEDKRELILHRLRSAILEAGATTNAQIKTAVEAQEWQL